MRPLKVLLALAKAATNNSETNPTPYNQVQELLQPSRNVSRKDDIHNILKTITFI